MSEKLELTKNFWSQQEKYNYYMIALCVASLGYSVNLTKDLALSNEMTPLGIAVFAWLISIYSGLTLINNLISYSYVNVQMLEKFEQSKYTLDDIQPYLTRLLQIQKNTARLGRIRSISFYLGMLSFLVWRVIEMM